MEGPAFGAGLRGLGGRGGGMEEFVREGTRDGEEVAWDRGGAAAGGLLWGEDEGVEFVGVRCGGGCCGRHCSG